MNNSQFMLIDLIGRIRNIRLPKSKPLLPLFEAVVNSIHSIDEMKINDGQIKVFISRDNQQTGLIDGGNFSPINGFKIIDNGLGFNTKNYNSFLTSDTTLKISRGSKGIGRFLWLKAFNFVKIDSTYKENNQYFKRTFNFSSRGTGVNNLSIENLGDDCDKRETVVELTGFQSPYKEKCPQDYDIIGQRILEHCISYFLLGSSPSLQVIDGDMVFDLKDYFLRYLKAFSEEFEFNLNDHTFFVKSLKFYRAESSEHKVSYCANDREVFSEELSRYIPDLISTRKIKDEDNRLFTYFAYVSGSYLDDCVNTERTKFNIYEENLELSRELGEVSINEIREEVISVINNHLSSFLTKIREDKYQEINRYVTAEAPEYRPILRYIPEKLNEIQPGLSKEKLDIELHKILSNYEVSLKEKGREILKSPKYFKDYPEYEQQYSRFLEEYNELGKSRLAKYIVHRKIILEIFAKNLNLDEDKKYSLEKDIHEIIFPLKRTSDNTNFDKQNLWIIDERLSFHDYLASDQPLNALENISIQSNNRPDLLIFNNPIAFVEGEEQPYSSIVVIEFKRPMREEYSNSDNPIAQVYDYIRTIKSGNFKDKKGRLVTLQESTPFYAYIICDLTPKIKEFAENASFSPTPDLQGHFGYNTTLNTYTEILSFNKLISDAKKRNSILFKKLGLQ